MELLSNSRKAPPSLAAATVDPAFPSNHVSMMT
jgi:hypothetical protein